MIVVISGQSWTDRNSVFRNWRSRWKLTIRRCWRCGQYLQICFYKERCCMMSNVFISVSSMRGRFQSSWRKTRVYRGVSLRQSNVQQVLHNRYMNHTSCL